MKWSNVSFRNKNSPTKNLNVISLLASDIKAGLYLSDNVKSQDLSEGFPNV